jgi:pimeloyl-ACP methyl ester carboxylesterase
MTLHFERSGSGEPLVLLHGIGHHWRAWEPVLDLLAEHHDVIAVDLPGFGRSPVPHEDQSMSGAVATLAGFFAESGLGRPHVAGNSLGGAIALELAAAGLVRSATALSPAGFATLAERWRALTLVHGHRLGAFTPTPLLRVFYRTDFGMRFSFGWMVSRPAGLTVERALSDTLAMRDGKGFSAVARRGRSYEFAGRPTGIPVTVAWASHDRVLLPVQALRARELLPEARHVTLDGCGHVPMSDDPQAVARVILQTAAATRTVGSP